MPDPRRDALPALVGPIVHQSTREVCGLADAGCGSVYRCQHARLVRMWKGAVPGLGVLC